MILGLHGAQGVGKDTVASILVGMGWKRLAHADFIREKLYAKNPLVKKHDGGVAHLRDIVDILGWDVAKRSIPAIRALLQDEGEADKKVFGRAAYAEVVRREMRSNPSHDYVITDIRGIDEARAILESGGYIIEVTRDGHGWKKDHPSEHRLPEEYIDATVLNNGTLTSLEVAIKKTLEYIQNASADGVPGELTGAHELRNKLMSCPDGLTYEQKVQKFLSQMGVTTPHTPLIPCDFDARQLAKLSVEEALEFAHACGYNVLTKDGSVVESKHFTLDDHGCGFNMIEAIDALADMDFVTVGNAKRIGVKLDPFRHIIADSNLKKFNGGHRDASGKWVKPVGFVGPGQEIEQELQYQEIPF